MNKLNVKTSNTGLQIVFDSIVEKCAKNIMEFEGKRVLVEGDQWPGLFLETQPMGGAMYAKFELDIAKNNIEFILDGQRDDGLVPALTNVECTWHERGYRWYGSLGFNSLAEYGLDIYYYLNKDKDFLVKLYKALEKYDQFLWNTRDSDGNGFLEQWGIVDTGEDDTTRLDLPSSCDPYEKNPSKTVESVAIMADSYANCNILAKISCILLNDMEEKWKLRAQRILDQCIDYFWMESKSAYFDRDHENNVMNCLTSQPNIRAMHQGMMNQKMVDAFIKEHLMNQEEFWTKMPIPSIAVNDNKYIDFKGKKEYCHWAGPSMGLTMQRAVRALYNYGHYAEVTLLGHKLIDKAIELNGDFPVQFDPLTGERNPSCGNFYGPMMLATMECFANMYGINVARDEIYWSGLSVGVENELVYTQKWHDVDYELVHKDNTVKAFKNNELVFEVTPNVRVVTDMIGNIRAIVGIDSSKTDVTLQYDNQQYNLSVFPNEVHTYINGNFVLTQSAPFCYPEPQIL